MEIKKTLNSPEPDDLQLDFNVIDALPANICILNNEATIIAVNKAWREFSVRNGGYPEYTDIGTNYLNACKKAADGGDAAATAVAGALIEIINGQSESYTIEYPCHSPDTERWFLLTLTSYGADKSLRIVASHFDITEGYLSIQRVKSAELLYHSVFNVLNEGLLVQDRNDKIITANSAAARILRLPINQLLGEDSYNPRWSATNEDNIPIEPSEHPSVVTIKTGQAICDYVMHISIGDSERAIISINTQPIFDDKNQVDKVLVSVRDITDMRNSQNKLRSSEYKFRSLMEQSPVAIHYHDMAGYLIDWNDAYARLFNLNEETLSSLRYRYNVLEDLQLKEIGISDYVKKVFDGDEVSIPPFEYDGSLSLTASDIAYTHSLKRHIKTRAYTLRDESDNKMAVVFLSEDVTELISALNQLKTDQLKLSKNLLDTVDMAMNLVESRDPYTAGHERRVSIISIEIAKQVGMNEAELEGLEIASRLHDIGKIAIPFEILSMPRRLTNVEQELIKTHVMAGYDILKHIEFPWPVAEIVLQHHERMDGSGYPYGISGNEIMLQARILAVADTIEAMTSHRPYRPGFGIEVALAEIEKNSGIKYDPEVVKVSLELFRNKHHGLPI